MFKFDYDEKEDILVIHLDKSKVKESIEVSEDFVIDIDNSGRIVGLEIFYAEELFNKLNSKITAEVLSHLEFAELKEAKYRNKLILTIFLKYNNKMIEQSLPLMLSHSYTSPLIASVDVQKLKSAM